MSYERRIQERVSLDIRARLSIKQFNNTPPDLGPETIIANLSGGGAFLQTNQRLPLATRVSLEFLLSIAEIKKLRLLLSVEALRGLKQEQVSVKATGVVIRQEEHGVGVIFDTNYRFTPMKAPNSQ